MTVHRNWKVYTVHSLSIFTDAKEKVSEASAKRAGVGVGFASEASGPHPLPSQVSFVLRWCPVLWRFYPRVQRWNKIRL